MRQIQISLKNIYVDDIIIVLKRLGYENIIRLEQSNYSLIIFRTENILVPKILNELNKIGVGREYGLIDILPLEATIPKLEESEDIPMIKSGNFFIKRIAMVEILEDIEKDSHPTFDYFIFIILSALIASIGLITNSIVSVIASMIISPLMGPILGFSYGLITNNKEMIKKSTIAQLFGTLSSIITGVVLSYFYITFTNDPVITTQMAIRTYPTIFDIIVSIAAGTAAGLCISGRVKSTMVGIAIALALMPPAVNIGITLIYGDFNLSLGSFILLLTNIILINITSIILMRLTNFRKIHSKKWFWSATKE